MHILDGAERKRAPVWPGVARFVRTEDAEARTPNGILGSLVFRTGYSSERDTLSQTHLAYTLDGRS